MVGHVTNSVPPSYAPDVSGVTATTLQIGVVGFGGLYLALAGHGTASADHAFALTTLAFAAAALTAIGCGPGRLTIALAERGIPVLGVDISRTAVARVHQAGACAMHRSVFDPLPGQGRWVTALLADGNIGIGGYPDELLRRCARLLAPGGRLLIEVEHDDIDERMTAWLEHADGRRGPVFPLGPAGQKCATQTRGRRRHEALRGMAARWPGFCFRHNPKQVNSKQRSVPAPRPVADRRGSGATEIARGWMDSANGPASRNGRGGSPAGSLLATEVAAAILGAAGVLVLSRGALSRPARAPAGD